MSLSPRQAGRLAEHLFQEQEGDPAAAAAPDLPERIGGCRIRRVIAGGGMGVVYEAEQERPRRTVAVKVMNRQFATRGRSALRRFEHEAEVLASLRHPGIAQVHEAGTWDDGSGGVPYFAMEYVPGGRPITAFAEERKLSLRARLKLFADVCDAVHHGHQKGIIHRDLKPANILVDEEGQAKVIDFGVARATNADVAFTTVQTGTRQLVGTLQYMSPEQCEGKALETDTRSDVYSLGVILYELLCGRLPYDVSDTSIPGATRIIQDEQPPQPGTIARALRGDLEAIILKALEKDRVHRYQSAAELAADIRRHLAGEPVEAGRKSAWARSVRWLGRHPLLGTAAAGIVIGLLTAASTALLGNYYLNLRPAHIDLAADGREARLYSLSGRLLHAWTSEVDRAIRFAELVRGADGRVLAVVGYSNLHRGPQHGALCVFDIAQDRERPLWTRSITQEETLPAFLATGRSADGFGVHEARMIDVFDQPAGPEIVVSYSHAPASAAALRIYDLDGDLLYQIWHDGGTNPFTWLAKSRLLTFLTRNAEVYWTQRGDPGVDGAHPRVVFAVRPMRGHIADRWTTPAPGGDTTTLAWYRCLLPPDACDLLSNLRLVPPDPGEDPGSCVRLQARFKENRDASVTWLIDASGTLSEPRPNDDWQLDTDSPDPDRFYLGDLPPIEPVETPD